MKVFRGSAGEKVGKLESWKVSYGQEAKTGMCDGNTTAL